jgi:hypothetical protein
LFFGCFFSDLIIPAAYSCPLEKADISIIGLPSVKCRSKNGLKWPFSRQYDKKMYKSHNLRNIKPFLRIFLSESHVDEICEGVFGARK